MEIGKGLRSQTSVRIRGLAAISPFPLSRFSGFPWRERRLVPILRAEAGFHFLLSIFLLALCLGGCASPGEPIERKSPVPTPVRDLSAEQSGNSVVLTFTVPRETTDRRPLKETPDIEIYRTFSPANPTGATAAQTASPSLLVTIPSAMVARISQQGQVRYTDALKPEDFSGGPNKTALYVVRTRVSPKKSSLDSNLVGLRINPAPDPIGDVKASIAHSAVNLTWTPPQETPIGPVQTTKTYRIYRAMMATPGATGEQSRAAQQEPSTPARATATTKAEQTARAVPAFVKIAESSTPNYVDSQVDYNKTYAYSVHSVLDYSGEEVESADSNVAIITVRDIFPPSAPQGIVVVSVPAEGTTPAHLELSWSINPETDIAGYNIYRSEEQGTLGTRQNPELLPTPTFRDMSSAAGRHYFYSVTTVDRSGNESEPSTAVAGELPTEAQPKP